MKLSGKAFPKYFSAIFSLLACVAYLGGLFAPIERIWHDRAFERRGEKLETGDPRLILIAVDDETTQKYGFPLPRVVYAHTLDKLREYGAKTVVFDVLFFEKREGDAELAAATKRHGGVVHLFTAEPGEGGNGGKPIVSMTVPALAATAQILGSPIITTHLENDGHIRTFSLFDASVEDPVRKGQPTASLSAVSIASFLGKKIADINAEFGGEAPPLHVLNYRRPIEWLRHEKDDESWLQLPRELQLKSSAKVIASAYRTISLMDILTGHLTAAQRKALKGSLSMIGSTTTGYYDHYPNPFTSHAPGAEYHLNVMDNVLHGDYLRATSVLPVLIFIFLAAWLPFLLTIVLPSAVAVAVASAGALIAGTFVSAYMMTRGTMIYPVAPALTLIASYLIVTVNRVFTEGAEKQMIKAKFGQFVSPEIVEELANDPEKAKLGAQKREMTVLFLDIAHFTTISEKMGPEALMQFLNRYLSALSGVMLDRRGTIDKYIGDCIMAFWNAPLENKGHARDAVLSALECQKAITELNKNLDAGLPETPAIRIGINTGQMNVGFTGTERKLAYTVIGDEVNLASRLEGANKFFGSDIMISSATYEGSKDAVEARYLGRARVVGKATPVPVYEPLAKKGELSAAWSKALPVWEKGVKAFYDKKYDESLVSFEEFTKLMPDDGPAALYLNLSRDYTALPPDDWDQVFNLTAK